MKTPTWSFLRQYTPARIAIGRAGHALPTSAHLQFQLDHARARDAVHQPLNTRQILEQLTHLEQRYGLPNSVLLHSRATHRDLYLQRPDLGRNLNESSEKQLQAIGKSHAFDIAIVVADGLSAAAIHAHCLPLLEQLLPELNALQYSIAPICIIEQARVAIADPIGALLQAKLSLILIGERPGLSSPDSLGIYLTYKPQPGTVDAKRNCISNIRQGGLSYSQASSSCSHLIQAALRKGITGVQLKDDSVTLDHSHGNIQFLKKPS